MCLWEEGRQMQHFKINDEIRSSSNFREAIDLGFFKHDKTDFKRMFEHIKSTLFCQQQRLLVLSSQNWNSETYQFKSHLGTGLRLEKSPNLYRNQNLDIPSPGIEIQWRQNISSNALHNLFYPKEPFLKLKYLESESKYQSTEVESYLRT